MSKKYLIIYIFDFALGYGIASLTLKVMTYIIDKVMIGDPGRSSKADFDQNQ